MKKEILLITIASAILLILVILAGCSSSSSPSFSPSLPPSSSNTAPNQPSNPNPSNDTQGIGINPILSWECSDPDGDDITYDIYFGTSSNPPLIESDLTTNTYILGTLESDTTYYWKIVAKDGHGREKEGPIWRFTTNPEKKAFLTIERNYIVKITEDGTVSTGIKTSDFCVDDNAKLLFTLTRSYDYSTGEFKLVNEYESLKHIISSGFGLIASVHNDTDDVDFYRYDGNFVGNIKFNDPPNNRLQNAYGIFLDENTFLLSEDGNNNIIKFNVAESSFEIFKSFDFGWLGAFYKFHDTYYIYTGGAAIYKFSETTKPMLVNKDFPVHITGMVVEDDFIYFVSNFGNGFFKYDMTEKTMSKVYDLHYPKKLYRISY